MRDESPRIVWTVGHSNHSFEGFASLLAREQIEFVVDVRSFPYSRIAPHFNREELAPGLANIGLGYLFLGKELGGRPAHDDQYDEDGHARYDRMAEETAFRDAVERLLTGSQRRRLALLCSEGKPDECHRRLLVGKVLTKQGVSLRHILPDGAVHEEDVVPVDSCADQQSLFGGEKSAWRSTRSVSHRRRLSASSAG